MRRREKKTVEIAQTVVTQPRQLRYSNNLSKENIVFCVTPNTTIHHNTSGIYLESARNRRPAEKRPVSKIPNRSIKIGNTSKKKGQYKTKGFKQQKTSLLGCSPGEHNRGDGGGGVGLYAARYFFFFVILFVFPKTLKINDSSFTPLFSLSFSLTPPPPPPSTPPTPTSVLTCCNKKETMAHYATVRESEAAKSLCAHGNQLYSERRYWDAIETYTEALDLKGDDSHLLSNRSAAYLNLQKGELALMDAHKCIELRPSWSKGYVKAALALRLLGDSMEAARMLERASEIDPHDPYIKVLEENTCDQQQPLSTNSTTAPIPATPSPVEEERSPHSHARSVLRILKSDPMFGTVPERPALSISPPKRKTMGVPTACPVAQVVTRQEFTSIRRLYNPKLSENENRSLFGKDTANHGQVFTLEVVLRGAVSVATGYVVPPAIVAEYLQEAVLARLDHKTLHAEVPFFAGRIPTNENILSFIWMQLHAAMSETHRTLLKELRLWAGARPDNVVIFSGEYRQECE